MRFKTDENLPAQAVELLRQHGHDAVSIPEQQMDGQPDERVASVCRAERRTLVTLDLGFSDIRAYPPEEYHGLIVLRPSAQAIPRVLGLVYRFILLLDREPLSGHLWIVDENRVRIRGSGGTSPT